MKPASPAGLHFPGGRFVSCLWLDLRLQFRHGFYYAYLVVCVFYIALLRLLPGAARDFIAPLIVYTDPALLGFFFIGGLVLLEKESATLSALFVTPLRVSEYIVSKIVSLTLLGTLSTVVITLGGGVPARFVILLPATAAVSAVFVLIGLLVVARTDTLNEFFLSSAGYMIVLNLPFIGYFGLWDGPVFFLWPSHPALYLIGAALGRPSSFPGILRSALILLAWLAAASYLTRRIFVRRVVSGGGSAQ